MTTITGKTNLVGLIGQPVKHSLSPVMHNAAYKEMGLDWCYIALPCEENSVEQIAKALRLINFKGLNITIPHKKTIIKACNKLTSLAQSIQAVNTLIPEENEEWIGANTDVEGFLKPLKNQNLMNKNVIVIGCGGSARAVVMGLSNLQVNKITIISRNKKSLDIFMNDMKLLFMNNKIILEAFIDKKSDLRAYIEDASLVVNTTPIGMKSKNITEETVPLGREIWNNISNKTILYDLIYTPSPTSWLKLGQQKNCFTIDGLDMLVEQGALSIKLWSGYDHIPINSMKLSAKKHLMS